MKSPSEMHLNKAKCCTPDETSFGGTRLLLPLALMRLKLHLGVCTAFWCVEEVQHSRGPKGQSESDSVDENVFSESGPNLGSSVYANLQNSSHNTSVQPDNSRTRLNILPMPAY
jgi:hypothetical protein